VYDDEDVQTRLSAFARHVAWRLMFVLSFDVVAFDDAALTLHSTLYTLHSTLNAHSTLRRVCTSALPYKPVKEGFILFAFITSCESAADRALSSDKRFWVLGFGF